jgi:hypothetical protein
LQEIRHGNSQTIQGEAGGSGYLDMLGVANVINNRALSNYGGYGTDPLVQANASGQFLGTNYSGTPSATAQTLANQVASGTLPNDQPAELYILKARQRMAAPPRL